MTPCEELGYKVGDKFKVTGGSYRENTFSVGSIVSLERDDGSPHPRFILEEGEQLVGGEAANCSLHKLTKLEESPVHSERKDTYVCLRWEGDMFTEGATYQNLSEDEGTLVFVDNLGDCTKIYSSQLSHFIKENEVLLEEEGKGECMEEDTKLTNNLEKSMDAHYNNWYTLTEEDKEAGKIKVDPYFYYGINSIGNDDKFGCKMHLLKNLSRHKDSNSKEREIIGLYKTIKRMAQLEGIDLGEEK